MTDASAWAKILIGDVEQNSFVVRQIQADCLRYAANLSGEMRDTFLIALADQLDPQPPHPKP